MKVRIHFTDGTSKHFYNFSRINDTLVQGIDPDCKFNTVIPVRNIKMWVELGEILHK